jgi:hypothetical protein
VICFSSDVRQGTTSVPEEEGLEFDSLRTRGRHGYGQNWDGIVCRAVMPAKSRSR